MIAQTINLRTTLLGIASWAIPLALSFLFFNASGELQIARPLFKSLMVVVGGGAGAALLVIAFRHVPPTLRTGLILGLFWLAINWLLDIVVLVQMGGMAIGEYFQDIGLRYLMIVFMAVAMGIVGAKQS